VVATVFYDWYLSLNTRRWEIYQEQPHQELKNSGRNSYYIYYIILIYILINYHGNDNTNQSEIPNSLRGARNPHFLT
jgi:hypothetical protein